MIGLDRHRVYLDWNASAPLRPEARAAMLEAMDVVGNPSSVHTEGRAARAIVEKARGQVAALVGCAPDELVFTSGATESAATVLDQHRFDVVNTTEAEHDCLQFHLKKSVSAEIDTDGLPRSGCYTPPMPGFAERQWLRAFGAANGETGVIAPISDLSRVAAENSGAFLCDAVQAAGKTPLGEVWRDSDFLMLSGHKFGGPKGSGALCAGSGTTIDALIPGGGQEKGRRSGTENVVGIAGFGAAAEAAQRDLEAGVWDRVENLRDLLEERLAEAAPDAIFFGKDARRLPNTSCFAVPGWKGETQVMQMDLAGFAVSAGSACSSGKVQKASRVLLAMGYDDVTASSAIRVSMGPTTTEAEVMAFADTWIDHYRRRKARAA